MPTHEACPRPLKRAKKTTQMSAELPFDKPELVRLMTQCIRDLGFTGSAELLEQESGVIFQSPSVNQFKEHVLAGAWEEALEQIPLLTLKRSEDVAAIQFLLKEQKYLELLEKGEVEPALTALQNELTPLSQDPKELQKLTSLIMCKTPAQIYEKHAWTGAGELSRRVLLTKLQGLVPASTLVPDNRLLELLKQAQQHQFDMCEYHSSLGAPCSLLQDHLCDQSVVPAATSQVLSQHTDEVWFVKFSSCGKALASSSKDARAIIWNVSGERVEYAHELQGHSKPVSDLDWSPTALRLLTASTDHTLKLWDGGSGQCISSYTCHEKGVQSCVWLADGVRFASAGLDKRLLIVNSESGTIVREFGISFVVHAMFNSEGTELIASCSDRKIRLFPTNPLSVEVPAPEASSVEVAVAEQSSITSVCVSRDGSMALVSLCSDDPSNNPLRLWDLRNRSLVREFQGHTQGRYVIR
eukprot:TRINITY_DN5000_c0_g1_i2.p1 TRINITY_DN5000_c0_g1~~TRINITY_DN5000_c0_g1_i2.p1  ORF type:complete len:469 (-),score=95.82 TRINITY_DN5000_c0_g1_i2:441-1847(-)